MKMNRGTILSFVFSVTMLMAAGCGKHHDEEKSPAPAAGTETKTAAPAQAVSVDADVQKPIGEVQTQVQNMTVESLRATAVAYKDAILAKQADVDKLVAKVKEIPLTEALGEEAKSLKGDLANLETSVKALKDRFQVYYDTLKQKGGDVSGLAI